VRYEVDSVELGDRVAFWLDVEGELGGDRILTISTKYDRYGQRK
jgi:hypothetical protein